MAGRTGTLAPLHDQPHQGIDTALMGVLLFIASEVMFFAGLFAAYFSIRAEHSVWPPPGFEIDIATAAVLTVILVSSSFTMQYALTRIQKGDRTGMIRAMGVTLVLGVLFLLGQLYDYHSLKFGISTGVYGTLFYTMTGFHGLHVLAGVVTMSVVLYRATRGQFSARHHTAVQAISLYWHFVDVVWIGLFSTLYILK